MQIRGHVHEATGRLAGQFRETLGRRGVHQETVGIDSSERADTNHVHLHFRTVGLDDRRVEARDLAEFSHLALHLVPEALELLDGRQGLGLRKLVEELVTARNLDADRRVLHHGGQVAGELLDHTFHFAQRTGACITHGFQFLQLLFVDVKGLGQTVATLLLGLLLALGARQQFALLVALAQEARLPRLVALGLFGARLTSLLQQLIQIGCALGIQICCCTAGQNEQCRADQVRAFHYFASLAAATGRISKSGAACFLAIRKPFCTGSR